MFSKHYPNITWWINNQGWVEIGDDNYSSSWIRIMDEGGTCWEDKDSKSLDESLKKADIWTSKEIEDRFGETPPKQYKNK